MKITDVSTIPISIPLIDKLPSFGTWPGQSSRVIVQVFTDEGITGIGESFGMLPSLYTVCNEIEGGLKTHIIGEDPLNIERIVHKLQRSINYTGRRGISNHAISGVEIALWDIIGKAKDMPLHQLLGGVYHDKVKAYASLTRFGRINDVVTEALNSVEEGYSVIKLHQRDPESVEAVRDAVGDDVELLVDVNCPWNRYDAVRMARQFEKYDVRWLEEPIWPSDDYDGLAALRQTVDIPIAVGENEDSIHGYCEIAAKHAVDIIQPSLTKTGILKAKRICAVAEAWNIQVAPHCWNLPIGLVATLHFITSTPNCMYLEVPHMTLEEELLREPIEIEKGFATAPTGPGLGVELNEETLVKCLCKE